MLKSDRTGLELISDGVAILSAHTKALLVLSYVSALTRWILNLPPQLVDGPGLKLLLQLSVLLPGIASYVFFGGALILVASAASSGESLQPGVALEASREKLRDGFWATLRGLGIFAGLAITILGLPWAISRATRWIFTLQAVVLDDQTNQTALNHSALLVVNLGWWVVFWRFLFLCLVIAIQVLRYTD